MLIKKEKIKKIIKKIYPFIYLIIFYFFIRLVFPGSHGGVYTFEFNKKILSTFRWYFLWSFGWPETMRDQFTNIFSIRDEFYGSFFKEVLIYINSLAVLIAFLILLPLLLLLSHGFKKLKLFFSKYYSYLILSIWLFFLGIMPVAFFPDHIYPHYLTVASFGLYFVIFFFAIKIFDFLKYGWKKYFFLIPVIVSWLIVSYTTVNLNQKVHWAPRHAQIAQESIKKMRLIKNKCSGKIIYVLNYQKDKKISLAEDKAIKLFLGKDWQIFYPTETEKKDYNKECIL